MEKWNVLLVDDEFEFVSTLAERLNLRGIDTAMASDGEEALRMIEEILPRLVVLDLMMPGMSGVEVLQQIKARHPEIRVILLTGHGSTREGIEGMRLGADDYLMKPINIDDLIEKMRKATGEKR
jgi:DNA-binding response OmpR family regulator